MRSSTRIPIGWLGAKERLTRKRNALTAGRARDGVITDVAAICSVEGFPSPPRKKKKSARTIHPTSGFKWFLFC